MSDQLSTAFVRQYHSNIEMKLQQQGGEIAGTVRQESQNSERQFYDQIGSVAAEQVTTRFAVSPVVNTPHDRRMVTLTPFHVGDFIDSFEKVQTLIDPSSAYVENFVRALGREKDRVVYQAMFGSASTGVNGAGTETYSTTASTTAGGLVVVADFATANSGLTIEKLIEADRVAGAQFWMPSERKYIIINSGGKADLLNTTEVTSADYNTVKTLVSGQVNTFMGMEFVQWEGYVLNGTNVMRGTGINSEVIDMFPVYNRDSLVCATGMDIMTRVTERDDRSFHWYAYARAMFGATRMQSDKVIKIERWISG